MPGIHAVFIRHTIMFVDSVLLKNFRSYDHLDISFSRCTNFIVGPNGSGKTNILEAIFVAANIRSFRGASDEDMVKWGEISYFCRIGSSGGQFREFEIGYTSSPGLARKKAKVDGQEIHSVSEYFGRLLTVIYSPGDILFITGSPDQRRRFFDGIIARTDRRYISLLGEFKKILSSRNRLLKNILERKDVCDELDVWDDMLALNAFEIVKKRTDFINSFSPSFVEAYRSVSGEDWAPSLIYQSSYSGCNQRQIRNRIESMRQRDLKTGFTNSGPHRDDYILYHDRGRIFSDCSSQGQKRMASIALKNAERHFIEKVTGEKVVILVDDVFSELDGMRRKNLVESLYGPNQVIFTMVNTDSLDISSFPDCRIFNTGDNGVVSVK